MQVCPPLSYLTVMVVMVYASDKFRLLFVYSMLSLSLSRDYKLHPPKVHLIAADYYSIVFTVQLFSHG